MRHTHEELEIIDLDNEDFDTYTSRSEEKSNGAGDSGKSASEQGSSEGKKSLFGNLGKKKKIEEPDSDAADSPEEEEEEERRFTLFTATTILLVVVAVALIAVIIVKISTWGTYVDLPTLIESIKNEGEVDSNELMDSIIPLTDAEGYLVHQDVENILLLGNDPFADCRDQSDSVAGILESLSGANVINASISGSYLASQNEVFDASTAPMDAYTLYLLAVQACHKSLDGVYTAAAEALGENIPEGAEEAVSVLSSIDLNEVDVIAIMYDGLDYELNHPIENQENDTDPTTYAGNLNAALWVIKAAYPNIRYIVMSPTFCYATDANGNLTSSEMVANSYGGLSQYALVEEFICYIFNISFMDNIFGTVTEDNASQYLADKRHLNVAGRQQVAERLWYCIDYYNHNEK